MEREFRNIDKFFIKLRKRDDQIWIVKLFKRTKNFRCVESKIDDFGFILIELEKRLDENVPAAVLHTVLGIMKLLQDQHLNFQEKYIEVVKENAILEDKMRLNDSWGEFLKKRASGDFEIAPSELSDEEVFTESINSKYSTAMLDGEKVIVKRVQRADNPHEAGLFAREARNLIMFSRGSIVRVFGMWDRDDEKFLVLEYMEKGTLSKMLQEEKELSLKKKIYLAMTAARSLKRMHLKLVHTALRTGKFLVDSDYTAKLSGMGYAVTFSTCKRYVSTGNPDDIYFFRAPERFRPCKPAKEADIYGFGIVLWEIFTQTKPFSSKLQGKDLNKDNVSKFIELKKEEYELNLQDPVNGDLSELVRRCRSFYPKDRPDISEIEQRLSQIYKTFLGREHPAEDDDPGLI